MVTQSFPMGTLVDSWSQEEVAAPFHPVVQELQRMIEEDPDLYMGVHQMFAQIPDNPKYNIDPLGQPQIRNYMDMLKMLDALLTYVPEFSDEADGNLLPLPICVTMNWPVYTDAGLRFFTNPKINEQMRKIFNIWANFLSSPQSLHVLNNGSKGWLSIAARKTMLHLEETFECDPSKEYWGFTSWDNFFTRRFRPGIRPTSHPEDNTIITSACESVTYNISYNVQAMNPFWIKGETYSLYHMLNHDSLSTQFVGGIVYQAHLTAFNYHRWHSPVGGTIAKIVHVPGLSCAVSPAIGFGEDPEDIAAVAFQGFMTNLATRVLIFIQADNADIGMMCFIGVGLAEISSCEVTVAQGQQVKKGDQLGMFHYGGSSHCLVFRPQTKIVFSDAVVQSYKDRKTLVLLNQSIGHLSK